MRGNMPFTIPLQGCTELSLNPSEDESTNC